MGMTQHVAQLAACVVMLRFLGPEVLTLVAGITPNKWFLKRRGLVAAVISIADASLAGFAPFFQLLIDACVRVFAVPCRAVPCRAVPRRAVPCRAAPRSAVQCSAVPCRVCHAAHARTHTHTHEQRTSERTNQTLAPRAGRRAPHTHTRARAHTHTHNERWHTRTPPPAASAQRGWCCCTINQP